jgi:hypothetical protein
MHSSNILVVHNPKTTYLSPQFNVIHHEQLTTVTTENIPQMDSFYTSLYSFMMIATVTSQTNITLKPISLLLRKTAKESPQPLMADLPIIANLPPPAILPNLVNLPLFLVHQPRQRIFCMTSLQHKCTRNHSNSQHNSSQTQLCFDSCSEAVAASKERKGIGASIYIASGPIRLQRCCQ